MSITRHLPPRRVHELRQTLRLAVPLVLGQLSAVGMNVIDAVLAGHMDAHTLGAVAVGTSVWAVSIVIAIGVMMALPPSVAQLHGAGETARIGPLFRQALWLAVMVGVLLTVFTWFGGPFIVSHIGIDPPLVADVNHFLRAVAFGAPALAVFFALRGLGEGIGLPRPTLYFSLFGLILLGPVGYVLMYGALGLPRLGAQGSGIATALVLWVQALVFAWYVARSRHYRALHVFARMEAPDRRALSDLLHIGGPMAVTLFMEASLFIGVALAIGTLGTDAIAGHQIAINVASVAFMLPLGIAMATTVRVGNAVGAGDRERVRDAGAVGLMLTLFTQTLSAGVMLLAPQAIARLYTSDAAVIAVAAHLLMLAGLFQFSDGIQCAANGALRGLKDTRVPMVITLFSYWLFGLPVGVWLAFGHGQGAPGLWIGLIAGLSMAAVLLTRRFWRLARRVLPGLEHDSRAMTGEAGLG